MSYLYKIVSTKLPPYFYEIIHPLKGLIVTRVVFELCVVVPHFSKIHFYGLSLMKGINWIQKY